MKKNNYFIPPVILFILSCLLFLSGNNILGLTNDNEVLYAQTAKEMIRHDSWMTPYFLDQPMLEKPIFIYWLLRIGFMFFGISDFGARFFPALFGAFGIIGVYYLCLLGVKDIKKAFMSSMILMSSGMYVGLAKTVFTDMVFSTLILIALLCFFWAYSVENRKRRGLLLFSFFAGLAVLTKGPLGLIIILSIVGLFLLLKKDIKFIFSKYSLWGIVIFLLTAAPWYLFMIKRYGNVFIKEFFYNDNMRRLVEAQHANNDRWYFYPATLIFSMFPWSLFVLASLASLPKYLRRKDNSFYVFLVCWIGIVFLILQAAHSKVANYILPVFPPVAILSGVFMRDIFLLNKYRRLLFAMLIISICLVLCVPGNFINAFIRYSLYISHKTPVYIFTGIFLMLTISMVYLLLKDKRRMVIYCLALVVPLTLCFLPFGQEDFSGYISSKEACEYLLGNYNVDNTILCSKFLMRGIKYYTDKDVAILDISGKGFFSPHPVASFNTEEDLMDFLHRQGITYCILGKSAFKYVYNTAGNKFRLTKLKVIGNEYILRIEDM